MKNRQRHKQKNKLRARLLLVAGGVSFMLTITAGLMVYLNVNNVSKTRATATGGEGSGATLGNGDILTEFTLEKDPVTTATLGPDAISVSKEAHSMPGGRSSTGGLSPGPNGKDIDLEIEGTELWNQEGIDISIDYSRNEKSGSFFSRENGFNFGFENGFISIAYRLENKRGGIESFKIKTEYEIPFDMNFRNYRFIYNPSKGKAEIFVNSVIVWSNQHSPNTPLSWKNAGKVTIAKGINGDGKDIAILDNLIVRTAGNTAPLAESLLNFMLEEKEGGIKIHWSTSVNDKIKSFTIERSINGVDFMNVANVPVNPDMKETEEYSYTDKTKATTGIVYYRLRQTFINGKFISHSLAAIKMQNETNLAIEKINPLPFDKSFDVAYFLPKSGKVWIQICDESGKVVDVQSFDAPKGKNVHVYKNEKIRESGTYTINLIFDNKKVTRSIVKI